MSATKEVVDAAAARLADAAAKVEAARDEFDAAQKVHAAAFRKALVELCNTHGFKLCGSEYNTDSVYIASTGALVEESDFSFSD